MSAFTEQLIRDFRHAITMEFPSRLVCTFRTWHRDILSGFVLLLTTLMKDEASEDVIRRAFEYAQHVTVSEFQALAEGTQLDCLDKIVLDDRWTIRADDYSLIRGSLD